MNATNPTIPTSSPRAAPRSASFLATREISFSEAEFAESRDEIRRRVLEEVLRQSFGEGEARRRSAAWDPQIQRALALVPKARLLREDPGRYVAEREAEGRVASVSLP